MKTKLIIPFIVLLIASTTIGYAQACNQARDIADRLAEVLETEKSKLKTTKNKVKKLTASQTIRTVKNKWNIIAGNSSVKMGPRQLFLDNSKVTGVVTGRTQRTFISPPSEDNKLKITLKKIRGKAKTEVYVCIHEIDGNSEQRKTYTFENGASTSTKTFTINNVEGKMISVIIRGKSVGNTFKYELKAKKTQ